MPTSSVSLLSSRIHVKCNDGRRLGRSDRSVDPFLIEPQIDRIRSSGSLPCPSLPFIRNQNRAGPIPMLRNFDFIRWCRTRLRSIFRDSFRRAGTSLSMSLCRIFPEGVNRLMMSIPRRSRLNLCRVSLTAAESLTVAESGAVAGGTESSVKESLPQRKGG